MTGPTEYQVTYWREIPTMVTARSGDQIAKVQLAARFQEAVDEAAMRLGDTGADDYLAGWTRGPWTSADTDPQTTLGAVAAQFDADWSEEKIEAYLNGLSAD